LPDVLFDDLASMPSKRRRALKAVLISGGRRFPKAHDLTELLHLVAGMAWIAARSARRRPLTQSRALSWREDAGLPDYEKL
jgi:HEPN domain-containing protein